MTELQCLQDKGYYRLCIETTIDVSYISVILVIIHFRVAFFSRDASKEKKISYLTANEDWINMFVLIIPNYCVQRDFELLPC